jgi:ectoine hydroxylase
MRCSNRFGGQHADVLILACNASPPNISPFGRTIVYLSLCHVDNHTHAFNCEEWIAHREFDPIEALEESCLMELIAY